MSGTTATWAIPYATSGDVFCDAYLTIQAMAERVDAILDDFDVDEARTRIIPLARVSDTVGSQQVNDGTTQLNVTFLAVDFDTTNLADLSVDPTSLVLEDDQYVLAGLYGNYNAPALTAGQAYDGSVNYVSGSSGSTFAASNQRSNGSNIGTYITAAGMQHQTIGSDRIVLDLSAVGASGTINVSAARMWVMKMGDG